MMKRFVPTRDARHELEDLGCGFGELDRKRKSGQLEGLCMIDYRTKHGRWLYDVEGIREKVMSGELYFGRHLPPVIMSCDDITVTIRISLDLARNLLNRDRGAEVAIIQEIRSAVGTLVKMKED